jgi:hypothetical protein
MLFQPTQPTLTIVFQIVICIKMNMVKKCVVIFEFSKDNSTKFLTPMA